MRSILLTGNWKQETRNPLISLGVNKKLQVGNPSLMFKISSSKLSRGFSFIELLVVIAIMGFLISVATASYSNFQRSTNIKNAALQLKSDLRLVQNKALAGDKRVDSPDPNLRCPKVDADGKPRFTLVGWYLTISEGSGTYTIDSACREVDNPLASDAADIPVFKSFNLPRGVIVSDIDAGLETQVRILFRPLAHGATIHSFGSSPPFYIGGVFQPEVGYTPPFKITLTSESGESYRVIIQPSGEISEEKI